MKALMFNEVRNLQYITVPDPYIKKSDDVLVKVKAASICGSDVHGYMGLPPGREPPLIMGHESCGEVIEVGKEVTRVKPGDRIFITPGISCNTCNACKDGRYDDCRDRRFYGANMPGGFAEYILISERAAIPLPDGISYDKAALIEPLSVAIKACSYLQYKPFNNVAVIGAGPIGLMCIAVLALQNPNQLVVINRNRDRREIANYYGAKTHIDPTAQNVWDEIEKLTKGVGVDSCVEAVGNTQTVGYAVDITRPGGIVVWAGNSEKTVEIDQLKAVFNQLRIQGTMGVTYAGIIKAMEVIEKGTIDVAKLLTIKAPLSEGADVFARMTTDRSIIKAILIP